MTRFPIKLLILALMLIGCSDRNAPEKSGAGDKTITKDGKNDEKAKTGDGDKVVARIDKDDKQPKERKEDKGPKNTPKQDDLTPEEIAKQFTVDRKAVEGNLHGKNVRLVGNVHAVWGKAHLTLRGIGDAGLSFHCYLKPEYMEKVVRLSRDQKVAINGVCDFKYAPALRFANCDLVELEPSKILVTTAEDLVTRMAKEFAEDKESAQAKYAKQDVIVTGVVEGPLNDNPGETNFKFKGTTKAWLSILMFPAEIEHLKSGSLVEVRCSLDSFREMDRLTKMGFIDAHSGVFLRNK